jgi:two-component system, OmpR family, sensor histidine kinase VanS
VKLRTRIFAGMASLSIGVVALTWILSFFLLEPYYLGLKRQKLVDISREIGEIPDPVSGIYERLASLERSTTVHISIVGSDGSLVYDSNFPSAKSRDEGRASPESEGRIPPFAPLGPRPNSREGGAASQNRPAGRMPPDMKGVGGQPRFAQDALPAVPASPSARTGILESKDGTIFETEDPRLNVRLLFLTSKQDSGKTLVLSFPLAQAQESAEGARLFLTLSSIVALALGAILSYLLAKNATRPFGELIALSKSIASLDFSKRFIASGNDEVAFLGRAMNELSDSLQGALAELERKNLMLREDVEREKRIDAMRREFISSVSHELKTPIALILGYAEGIQEGVAGDHASREAYLSVIIDEARKMDGQVRDLLELSQIDSGVLPLRLERFDLREIVSETLSSFARTLEELGLSPKLELEEAYVLGDRAMLGRAFVNYFSNAVSHVDERGLITVAARPTVDSPGATLSVYNSGPHIPAKSLERIWDSYYKVDEARTRRFGGTGLGLAIARGIAARHGGRCSVENVDEADGPGVRFELWVPAAPQEERPETSIA